jgi:hypothetical protein
LLSSAHIALMRENWWLVPEALRIARRTMTAVKINIGFTAIYNLTGLTLAALGLLPPIDAAAQAGPDATVQYETATFDYGLILAPGITFQAQPLHAPSCRVRTPRQALDWLGPRTTHVAADWRRKRRGLGVKNTFLGNTSKKK